MDVAVQAGPPAADVGSQTDSPAHTPAAVAVQAAPIVVNAGSQTYDSSENLDTPAAPLLVHESDGPSEPAQPSLLVSHRPAEDEQEKRQMHFIRSRLSRRWGLSDTQISEQIVLAQQKDPECWRHVMMIDWDG